MITNQASPALQQKKRPARSIIKALLILGTALVVGFGFSKVLSMPGTNGGILQQYSSSERIFLLVWLIVSLFLVLLLHECGHILAGLLQRCRFELLIVGPLKVAREHGKIRVGLNKSLALAGGLAATSPQDTSHMRRRFIIIVLGGPLASFVFAGLLWALSLSFPEAALWRNCLQLTGLLSLIIFLVTALPLPMGTFYTDGARALMLLRKGEEARRWAALISLQRLSLGVQPPMHWNGDLMHQATARDDASMDNLIGCWLSYYAAVDRDDEAWAGQLIERLKHCHASATTLVSAPLALDIAYFVARYQRNATEAAHWYAQGKKAKVPRGIFLRTEAALALSQNKFEETRAKAEEGQRELSRITYVSMRGFEERRLNDLLQVTSGHIVNASENS
ncbi:MAG: M50 family metallopeptidase [Ktedonobacteraceae bacterium]|nr:M50 family metallopeptidase [Ktedonobacteraceae bacterium]